MPAKAQSANDSKNIKIGPWVLGAFLGQGFAAQVREAQHEKTGQKAAIKIITKDDNNEKADLLKKMREKEISIMKLVDHPNIVRLYDVYETSTHIYLVMELLQGSLFSYVVKSVRISPSKALVLFQQIIEALDYMHRHLICHRDLKPENFLLNSQTTLKVCDFGFASLMKENDEMQRTRCGTLHYASPDILTEGDGYDGRLHDVWSAGVNLYVMVTGELPFNDKNPKILLRKITSGTFEFPPQVPLPYDLKDLIFRMLTVDPKQRISITDIKRHPWYCTKPYTVPQDVVGHINIEEPIEDIDEQILKAIVLLGVGWENVDDILSQMKKKGANSEKVVYLLLLRKKLNPSMEAYSYSYVEKIQRAASGTDTVTSTTTTTTTANSPPVSPAAAPENQSEQNPQAAIASPRDQNRTSSSAGSTIAPNDKKKKTDPPASLGRSAQKKGLAPGVVAEQNQAVSSIDKILNWFNKDKKRREPPPEEAAPPPAQEVPDEEDPFYDLLFRSTSTAPKKGDLRIRTDNPSTPRGTVQTSPTQEEPKKVDTPPKPVEPQPEPEPVPSPPLDVVPENNQPSSLPPPPLDTQKDPLPPPEQPTPPKTEKENDKRKSRKSKQPSVSIYVNFIPSDQSKGYEAMQRNHNGIPLHKCVLQYRDPSGELKHIMSRADLEAVSASGIPVVCVPVSKD